MQVILNEVKDLAAAIFAAVMVRSLADALRYLDPPTQVILNEVKDLAAAIFAAVMGFLHKIFHYKPLRLGRQR